MACRHVHMATRSSSTCSIMDEAHGINDDDDSIAGRCFGIDVDDSERVVVRDLLVSLIERCVYRCGALIEQSHVLSVRVCLCTVHAS